MADGPVKATGLFGKVMRDISARAREYRVWESTGSRKPATTTSSTDWPERFHAIQGCPRTKWDKTFESFEPTEGMAKALDAAQGMAQGKWQPWCLVLSGSYGCGKTHLAYAVANVCRISGRPYRMTTAPALMAQLKSAIDERKGNPEAWGPEDWVKMYSETKALLILDDFGAQQDTEWATTQLFSVLNTRYERTLSTLITTNLGAKQIDPRLGSRIGAGLIICDGADLRRRFD